MNPEDAAFLVPLLLLGWSIHAAIVRDHGCEFVTAYAATVSAGLLSGHEELFGSGFVMILCVGGITAAVHALVCGAYSYIKARLRRQNCR